MIQESTPKFPVVLWLKDEDSYRVFDSFTDLQGWVEPIDVENNEYLAWDALGRRTELVVLPGKGYESRRKLFGALTVLVFPKDDKEVWLDLRVSPDPDPGLRERLVSYLSQIGSTSALRSDLEGLFQAIRNLQTQRR